MQLLIKPVKPLVVVLLAVLAACGKSGLAPGANNTAPNPELWPALDRALPKDDELEQRIQDILHGMSNEEKVGQVIVAEIKYITPEQAGKYHLGAVLNGGGTAPGNDKTAPLSAWTQLADRYHAASTDRSNGRSGIPILWGSDAVHGHNNVRGTTIFPHNIGLGAARDPELIERIGMATAREVRASGLDWTYAPTVAVAEDTRWGRSYESYAEEPEIVSRYARSMVEGIQGQIGDSDFLREEQVVATAKHYLGDGGTERGIDRGDTLISEQGLVAIHAQGFISALNAGVQTIMTSFSSWNGDRVHGHHYLLTTILKERMGFDGFVVGDWNGHRYVPGCQVDRCAAALNAGLDMFMTPSDWEPLFNNTLAQVQSGEIPMARLDDAVSRILRVKLRAGLFEAGPPSSRKLAAADDIAGSAAHRSIAREAVRKSLVLLKNNGQLLPLSPAQNILVVGDGADSIGKQAGGWTLTWQGTGNSNADFPGATSIFQGIAAAVGAASGEAVLSVTGEFDATTFRNGRAPDVVIAVFGEDPYAEWHGDIHSIEYQAEDKSDLAMLRALKARKLPLVSVFLSGRPLWINPELNTSDAFVAAWLPGSEGAGVADVLFRDAEGNIANDFSGTLSFSWPRYVNQASLSRRQADYAPLFPFGFGMTFADSARDLPQFEEDTAALISDELGEYWLFASRAIRPWQLQLRGAGSAPELVTANRASIGDNKQLSIASIDRWTQEDARQLVWRGGAPTAVALAAPVPQDLASYLSLNSALHLDLRLDTPPTEAVYLSTECAEDCTGTVDISDLLTRDFPPNEWGRLSIDLRCLTNTDTIFNRVQSAAVISTRGQLGLSLADIRIIPNLADSADLQCPQGLE